jgi:hypothetical protein
LVRSYPRVHDTKEQGYGERTDSRDAGYDTFRPSVYVSDIF